MFLHEFVVVLSHSVYDGQLSFGTINNVHDATYLKSYSYFKLFSVFQPLVLNGFLTFNIDIYCGVIRPGSGLNKTLIKSFIRNSN